MAGPREHVGLMCDILRKDIDQEDATPLSNQLYWRLQEVDHEAVQAKQLDFVESPPLKWRMGNNTKVNVLINRSQRGVTTWKDMLKCCNFLWTCGTKRVSMKVGNVLHEWSSISFEDVSITGELAVCAQMVKTCSWLARIPDMLWTSTCWHAVTNWNVTKHGINEQNELHVTSQIMMFCWRQDSGLQTWIVARSKLFHWTQVWEWKAYNCGIVYWRHLHILMIRKTLSAQVASVVHRSFHWSSSICKDNTSKDPFSQCEQLQGTTRDSHAGEKWIRGNIDDDRINDTKQNNKHNNMFDVDANVKHVHTRENNTWRLVSALCSFVCNFSLVSSSFDSLHTTLWLKWAPGLKSESHSTSRS